MNIMAPNSLMGDSPSSPMLNRGQGRRVDIAETIQLKAEAFACHASQVKHPAPAMASIRERAARLGQGYGFAYAEGFTRVVAQQPVPTLESN
jgi:LmbE family N-acetylglucosaminyl deacetylase